MMKKVLSLFKPLFQLPWLPVWLISLVLFSPLIFTGRPMYWGAVFLQFTPWRVEAFNQILAGQLPLWNSLNGMGAPLAANYQSALFYPPTWLLLPFYILGGAGGLAMGETWSVVVHLIWSGIGMVFLVRQLGSGRFSQAIAALAFSLSGYLVTRATFLSINATVAWLPWVILAAERLTGEHKPGIKATLVSALVIGMLLLAGHAQTAFYTLLLAGCWVLFRQSRFGWKSAVKVAFNWSLSVILGCGLAAIQLIPTAEYLMQSQRAAEIGYDYAVNYSFLPWRFLTLLMANLFGTPADGTYLLKADAYWEDAIYIGLLPLALGLGALLLAIRKKRSDDPHQIRGLTIFLAVMAAVASLIALGSYTPIFPLLYKYVPTFDLFQAPARWMIWLVFAFSILAGIGAKAWHHPGKWGRFTLNLSLALGVTVTIIAILAGILMPELPAVFIKAFIIFGVSIALGCILAKTNPLSVEKEGRRVSIWQWAVVAFVSVDLLLANWGFHQGADPSLYEKATAAAKAVKAQSDGGRIYISGQALEKLQYGDFFNFRDLRMDGKWDLLADAVLPDTNLYGGLASANNFDPLVPERYGQVIASLEDLLDNLDGKDDRTLLNRMNVTWIEYKYGQGGWVGFYNPFPSSSRFRWIDCFITIQNPDDAFSHFIELVEVNGPVILESYDISENECTGSNANIRLIDDQPAFQTWRVIADSPGWLVVLDLYYPGWRVYTDDQRGSLKQVDYLFRGVYIDVGEHVIRMEYRPLSFYAGCGITIICMIVILGIWIYERRKEKRINLSSQV
jgi:uncharacterized membrane protein YfhO